MDFKSRPTVEGAPVQVWRGAWSAGTYFPGDSVVNDGSTYVAVVITANEPPHSDWDEVEVALGGGALSDTAYEEDTAIGATGWGQFIGGRRDDSLSTLTPVEDDFVGLRVNSRGALWVVHDAAVLATAAGDIAHDAADGGNPVKIGGKAESTSPAVVADGDRVDAWFDTLGAQVVRAFSAAGVGADGISNEGISRVLGPGGSGGTLEVAPYIYNGGSWDRLRGNTSGLYIHGGVAHDAADAGNPLKIGGKYISIPSAVADFDRVDAQFDQMGKLGIFIGDHNANLYATVRDLAANDALNVAIVDAAGDQITSFGGGTQYAEDAALGTNGTGTLIIARRDNALSVLTPAENDAVGLRVNNRGALWAAIDNTEPIVLGAGTANIGDVDVLSLPALPAGTNNIGDVDVLSLPALPAGTNNIGDVDVLSLPASTNTLEVVGDVAQDAAIAGNPLAMGLRASTALPTPMSADGDSVYAWANRNGAQVIAAPPHVGLNSDPYNLVHEAAQYTSTQTSAVLVAGGASEKLVVTKVQIQAFGTTAFDLQLYFGTGAFARGTNRAIFDGTFKPSATLAPGVVMDGPFISGTNGDDLLVTTSAAGSVTINVWYYVVT